MHSFNFSSTYQANGWLIKPPCTYDNGLMEIVKFKLKWNLCIMHFKIKEIKAI